MNLAVFGIVFNPEKNQVFQNLFQFFHEHAEIQRVSIYAPFYNQLLGNIEGLDKFGQFENAKEIEHFDMMICLGGDGSILDSLALIKDKKVMILSDQKKQSFYTWNKANNSLKPLPIDKSFLKETISWYQTADYLFTNKLLE